MHSKLWAYCKCANRRGLSFFAQDKFWRFWRCIGEREDGFVAEYQARYVSFYWTLCRLIPSPDTNVSPRDDVNTAARTSRPANRQPLTRQPRVSTVGPATATSGRSASLNRVRSRSLTRKQQLVTLRSQKGLASMLAPSCFFFCFWSRRITLGWPSPCSLSLLFGILSLLRICFKFFFHFVAFLSCTLCRCICVVRCRCRSVRQAHLSFSASPVTIKNVTSTAEWSFWSCLVTRTCTKCGYLYILHVQVGIMCAWVCTVFLSCVMVLLHIHV